MHKIRIALSIALLACAASMLAQTTPESPSYSRRNAFGFFAAYSNDSSHILLGDAENRKLLNFGGMYNRRLWLGRSVNWQYSAEVLPVALESDPVIHEVTTYTSPMPVVFKENLVAVYACHDSSGSYSQVVKGVTYSYSYADTCTRRWTIGEAISPVGMQWNFLPRRRLQPFLVGHGGYMYSTTPIPVDQAGSFNFTFDGGVGLEFYRMRRQSFRAEIRYHHISNHDTATANPGIDNALIQVAYAFGQ